MDPEEEWRDGDSECSRAVSRETQRNPSSLMTSAASSLSG